MGPEVLVVLGLICWWVVLPALIVGLRLRRVAWVERSIPIRPAPLPCEARSRPRRGRVRNLVDI
jgi:hypothetical protein